MSAFGSTYAVVAKDIRSEWRTRYAVNSLLMFVVTAVSIILFALRSVDPNPELLSGMLWVVIFFTAMSGMSRVFVSEEERGTTLTLQLVATPTVIYFGKLLFNSVLILFLSFIITAMYMIFFSGFTIQSPGVYVISVVLGSLGFASASTIIAAIIAKTRSRGTLYAVLLFPLLIIPLMVGMSSTIKALEGSTLSEALSDFQVLASYLMVMVAGSYLLFDYVWKE
ncbi:MAG: heme exporter protein CcmB [Ignavibacteriales bacterium]|nr:heme exporter protein CcmB [Ignavibacteriales bacterium]